MQALVNTGTATVTRMLCHCPWLATAGQWPSSAYCELCQQRAGEQPVSMISMSHLAGRPHQALVAAGTRPRPQGGPGEGSAALTACQALPPALLREGASQEVLPLLGGALSRVLRLGMLAGQPRGRQGAWVLVRPRVLLALLLVLLLEGPLLQR